MSLKEVQSATGGILAGGDAEFRTVSIDSRTLEAGDLFIAIKGPNFNGNTFVGAAAEKRACGAIVSEPVEGSIPTLTVEDTRRALGMIGAMNRTRSTACIIALTGSQGKTTVKEMTASILSECGSVMMTKGNLNNDLGVPLSLIRIEDEHDFAVIELGANTPGEIAYTVELTRPSIGHITNIAGTHLEGFGDLDGVARAKAEIWQGIRKGGTAVVNIDDAFADRFIEQIRKLSPQGKLVTLSAEGNPEAGYRAENTSIDQYHSAAFNLVTPKGETEIMLPVPGKHNISNAVAAAALAMTAGADLGAVRTGLEKFSPVKGRMCIVPGLKGSTVIDDSYNASPASFRAAIDVLAVTEGNRVVVMGDMGELGSEAEQAHRGIGEYVRSQGIEHFLAVGTLSRLAVDAYGKKGRFLEDRESFADVIIPLLDETTTVLVKGSRSQSMEKLVKQIMAGVA